MSFFVIGIDPGLHGCVACIDKDSCAAVEGLPIVSKRIDVARLGYMLATRKRTVSNDSYLHCYIEKAQAFSGMGVTGAFHYGLNYGMLLAVLVTLEIPYTEVHPGVWKKRLGLSKEKDAARARAMQLFPGIDLHLKKDHDKAEALLLAFYGKSQLTQQKLSSYTRIPPDNDVLSKVTSAPVPP